MSPSSLALSSVPDLPVDGPAAIATHADLVAALDALRRRSPDGHARRRVTLKQISADAGIPVSTVHSYLSGRSIPPVEALAALVQVLGVAPGERTAWLNALDRVQTAVRRPSGEPARRTISPPLRDFVGRAETLAHMTEEWQRSEGRSPIIVLTGPGGIGKTSLALEWAHRHVDQFPDGSLQVDMDGFGVREPMGAPRAHRLLLTALGVNPADLPTDPDELAIYFQAETSSRQLLVLLDNVRDASAVEPLLATGPGVTTVVTSRDTMRPLSVAHGVHPIRVPLMDADEAIVLLQRASGGAPLERVEQAASECGGLPLALRLSADSLAMPAGPYGRPTHLRLVVEGVDRGVRGAIQSSLDVLDDRGREAFVRLGALPGRVFSQETAAVVLGEGSTEALDELVGLNLLEPTQSGWLRHGLVGEVAWELANASDDTAGRRAALLRHYVWVARSLSGADPVPVRTEAEVGPERHFQPEHAAALRDLELGSMLRLCEWGFDHGEVDLAASVLDALACDLETRGESSEVQALATRLANDESASAGSRWVGLRTRGRWAQLQGHPEEEVHHYRAAVELLEGHPELRHCWRAAMVGLGSAMTVTDDRDAGVATLREIIRDCDEAGEYALKGKAENALAGELVWRREYDEGLDLFASSARSHERANYHRGAIIPLANGVRAALWAHDTDPNGHWVERARDLMGQLEPLVSMATLPDQVMVELARAALLQVQGRLEQAMAALDRAGELAARSHDAWEVREVASSAIGILAEMGRYDEAIAHAETVLQQSRDMNDRVYEASSLISIAENLGRARRVDEARARLAEATALLEELNLLTSYAQTLEDVQRTIDGR